MSSLRIGIDIGGTFTDFVVYDPSTHKIRTFKLLSTPHDPAEAILAGLASIFNDQVTSRNDSDPSPISIIHGSTIATNALLERKGARTALVTTQGFEDILQIGRQNRSALYEFNTAQVPPLVPAELRFGVKERVDCMGNILQPLDPSELDDLIRTIKRLKVTSVAVCLLFSFLKPEHERIISEALRQAGFSVSLSSEICPEYREYERTSTTVVNAYVSPVVDSYLSHLDQDLADLTTGKLPDRTRAPGVVMQVMQSNGGSISITQARHQAVRCILSGPAGGVVGCEFVGRNALTSQKLDRGATLDGLISTDSTDSGLKLITFDMGGTSTDVSLVDSKLPITSETVVGGCPIRIPLLDIHTIGAGGGSIARMDPGGALRVGPESTGANPGPACYGRGDLPTITDANVVLGRIPPEHFLGGKMPLNFSRAYKSFLRLGNELNMTAENAALGVISVANASMERALRLVSVERGRDPRYFTLISFGGAGGLHAAELARGLGIPRILVPPLASTLSAFGMLAADVVKDYVLTVMLPGDTPQVEITARLEPWVERGRRELLAEGFSSDQILMEQFLDMRYRGQSFEITVPFNELMVKEFHRLHEFQYGYANLSFPIEVVNLRIRAVGLVTPPPLVSGEIMGPDPHKAFLGNRDVLFPQGKFSTPLYQAESLEPGNHLLGPGVIVRSDTTILIGLSDEATVDSFGNLMIEVGR